MASLPSFGRAKVPLWMMLGVPVAGTVVANARAVALAGLYAQQSTATPSKPAKPTLVTRNGKVNIGLGS
jgi:hypothetical protein